MTTGRHLVALRGDETDLHHRHHRVPRRAVARRDPVSGAPVGNACQQA